MKNKKIINQVSGLLSAIAASVLTEQILNIYVDSNYKFKEISDGEFLLEQISYSPIIKILATIVFIGLWITIALVLPLMLHWFEQEKHKNIPIYSKKELQQVFYDSKNKIFEINKCMHENTQEIPPLFYLSDIIQQINLLYKYFYKTHQPTVKSAFRSGVIIDDVGKSISIYDFKILIDLINNMVEHIYISSTKTEILDNDYTNAKDRLKKLKTVYK